MTTKENPRKFKLREVSAIAFISSSNIIKGVSTFIIEKKNDVITIPENVQFIRLISFRTKENIQEKIAIIDSNYIKKFNNIPFYDKKSIEEKENFSQFLQLVNNNVKLYIVNESYTSQACCNCGYLNKPNDRKYNCQECNLDIHRDVNGAVNIALKHLH